MKDQGDQMRCHKDIKGCQRMGPVVAGPRVGGKVQAGQWKPRWTGTAWSAKPWVGESHWLVEPSNGEGAVGPRSLDWEGAEGPVMVATATGLGL